MLWGCLLGFIPRPNVQIWPSYGSSYKIPVCHLKSAYGEHFDLFELTIKWAMAFDRSFLISVSISLIVWQSDFKIECKFHWNPTTDEPGMPSSATRSFAPSWKWSLMVANLVKMMTFWWGWSWVVLFAFSDHLYFTTKMTVYMCKLVSWCVDYT